jgi:tape measure domain-containing protein
MSSVDSRIVNMKFNNAAFESGARTTMSTLDRLKNSLNFSGASKGLDNLKSQTGKFNLNAMEGAVTGVSKSFMAMSTIAITALAGITQKAMSVGSNLAKALTVEPIMAGLREYETQLNSIQTIMANTASQGTTMKQVNASLEELNQYSDKTIYNFEQMARNIGTFTAAGINLDDSTAAIKGIANLAAVSGSNADQASTAMYQLSQALASGKVGLQDWNSVVNAGMGGAVFKDALKETARAHGVAVDAIIKKTGSFRDSLKTGWITADILTETLSKFTGDLSKKQLISMGYTTQQAKEIMKMAQIAQDAATKVKTATQLVDTLKEAAGSGWSKTWSIVIGNFKEARKLWTGVSDVLGGMIQKSADARNAMLSGWKVFGGRDFLIQAVGNAFKALMAIIKPIQSALRDIFPPMTGLRLAELTKNLRDFTKGLIIGKDTAKDLKSIFKGVFSVFSLIGDVIGGAVGVVGKLFGVMTSGSGGVIKMAASFGDFVTNLVASIKASGVITSIFEKLGSVLAVPVKWISQLIGSLAQLAASGQANVFLTNLADRFQALKPVISGAQNALKKMASFVTGLKDKFSNLFSFSGAGDGAKQGVSTIQSAMSGMSSIGSKAKAIWSGVIKVIKGIGSGIKNLYGDLTPVFSSLKDKLLNFVKNMGIEDAVSMINTGFFIAMYMTIRSFFKKMGGLIDSYGGMYDNLGGLFGQLTSSLKTMQNEVRSDILLKIAGGLALLAAAVFVLSKVDASKLGVSLGALAAMLGIMVVGLKALEKGATFTGSANLVLLSVSLIALSVGLLALSGAVAVLGSMELTTLAKGIGSIAVVIGVLVAAAAALSKSGGAGQLLGLSASILVMSFALTAFAAAIKLYSLINTDTLLSGGLKIAATLATLALVMRLMPKGMLSSAASLIIVSAALNIMALALKGLSGFSIPEMAKSLTMLGGALLIISIAMNAMQKAIPGAAAMLLIAAALAVMVPPLMLLGQMSLGSITMSLIALAGAFTVIGLAAYVIGPMAPALIALAAGIALLGVAALAVGGGLALFAVGLASLAASGAAGAAVLVGVIISIANTFPLIMQQVGMGIAAFAKVMTASAPILIAMVVAMIKAMLDAFIKNGPAFSVQMLKIMDIIIKTVQAAVPKLAAAGLKLITTLLNELAKGIPGLSAAGTRVMLAIITAAQAAVPKITPPALKLIATLINSIANNLGPVITAGANLVIKFISGLGKHADGIITAGVQFVIKVMQGIGKHAGELANAGVQLIIKLLNAVKGAIDANSGAVGAAAAGVGWAIIRGMASGIWNGIRVVTSAAASVASRALAAAKEKLGINSPSKKFYEIGQGVIEGFVNGINSDTPKVEESLSTLFDKLVSMSKNKSKPLAAQGKAAVQIFKTGLAAEKAALTALGVQYDELTVKIQEAQSALEAAIKTRDDVINSYAAQYGSTGEITEETTVEQYAQSVRDQAAKTNDFLAGLNMLRSMGLDDATYKKILDQGLGAKPFIDKLLAAGPAAVAAINAADAALSGAAAALGITGGTALYQAGVNAAQGLVDGLKSQQGAIKQQMVDIAKAMVKAIKKALKIKSPSKIFADVGLFTNKGLALGLRDNTKLSVAGAQFMADKTLGVISKTLSNVGTDLSSDVNLSPVIAPVLDLAQFRRDANGISSAMTSQKLAAGVSLQQASSIVMSKAAAEALTVSSDAQVKEIKFEQNNYSPTALSPSEIYRNTRSQLAMAQEALSA